MPSVVPSGQQNTGSNSLEVANSQTGQGQTSNDSIDEFEKFQVTHTNIMVRDKTGQQHLITVNTVPQILLDGVVVAPSSISTPISIADGGTNATSFAAPMPNYAVVFYDGTRLNSDANLVFEPSNKTLYATNISATINLTTYNLTVDGIFRLLNAFNVDIINGVNDDATYISYDNSGDVYVGDSQQNYNGVYLYVNNQSQYFQLVGAVIADDASTPTDSIDTNNRNLTEQTGNSRILDWHVRLNFPSVPRSSTGVPAGLNSGDVWCDTTGGLNILKIV